MIWKSAELYNVAELVEEEGRGYAMLRYPKAVADGLSVQGQAMNQCGSGTEIRFRIRSGSVRIRLSTGESAQTRACASAEVFYGDIAAGWTDCTKQIFETPTDIMIPPPENMEALERIHAEHKMLFSPRLVRVVLPGAKINIYEIEGDIEPPDPQDVPAKRFLAYGSSITFGSLCVPQAYTWVNRVAQNMGADLINMGLAGSARLEKCAADYIASRDDFDFATLEMGINVMDLSDEEFERRVRYFISAIAGAHPDKIFFCMDVFFCYSDILGDKKAAAYRQIVRKVIGELKLPNTVYLDGSALLTSSRGVCGDLTHPSIYGVEEITANLTAAMMQR